MNWKFRKANFLNSFDSALTIGEVTQGKFFEWKILITTWKQNYLQNCFSFLFRGLKMNSVYERIFLFKSLTLLVTG